MRGPDSLRITGGRLRGQRVAVPGRARPTTGRVREALFSIWGEQLPGARFLDLFAGSGGMAIEAISRGAASATCLESDLRAVRLIEDNATRLVPGSVEVRRLSLPGGLAAFSATRLGTYDLAVADPPYDFRAFEKLLVATGPLLTAAGEIILEHSARCQTPEQVGEWRKVDVRDYGESALSRYRRRSQGQAESHNLENDLDEAQNLEQ